MRYKYLQHRLKVDWFWEGNYQEFHAYGINTELTWCMFLIEKVAKYLYGYIKNSHIRMFWEIPSLNRETVF